MVKRSTNNKSLVGHWCYNSGSTYVFEVHKESSGNLRFKQKLKQWGMIDEPLEKKGQWYEIKAPHGMLRLKLLNDIMVSQFKRINSNKWGKHVMSKRTVCDIEGLWYSTTEGGYEIQKRLCTITRDKISFFNGPDCFFTWTDSRELTCRIDGKRYSGMVLDNEIHWNDGDIWKKKQNEEEGGNKKKKKKKRKKKKSDSVRDVQPGLVRRNSMSSRQSTLCCRNADPKTIMDEAHPNKQIILEEHNKSAVEKKPRSYSEGDNTRRNDNKKSDLQKEVEQNENEDVNRLLKTAFANKQRNLFLQQTTGEDLREPKTPRSTRRMRWDENNLRLNEIERPSSRMAIDEPNTPWNELTDEELMDLVDDGSIPSDHPEIGNRQGLTAILAENLDFTALLAKQAEERRKDMEDEKEASAGAGTERDQSRNEFIEKRTLHYNEGHIFNTMTQNPDLLGEQIVE